MDAFGGILNVDNALLDRVITSDGKGTWMIVNTWASKDGMDAGNAAAQAAPEMADFGAAFDFNAMSYFAYEVVE